MASGTPYQHTPIDSARGEIRVLVIPPAPGDQLPPSTPVACRVQVCSLASNLEYDAVSYTRSTGDGAADARTEDQNIIVDGAPFSVSANAANALACLRVKSTPSRSIRVWIDAICINQEDDTEKAQQILLMGRIYRQARQVRVWLGPCEDFSKHPWWMCLWVVQEAVLAKRLVYLLGDGVERTWQEMEKEMQEGMGRGIKGSNFAIIQRARDGINKGTWDPSIHTLLYALRGLGCTYPSDRIYAVLGLIPGPLDLGSVPAYDAPVTRVQLYTDLTRKIIRETGSLEVLNCVREWRHGNGVLKNRQRGGRPSLSPREPDIDETMLGLPSWVPNWSVHNGHDPEPLVDLFKQTGAPGRYSAAKLMKATLGERPGGDSTLALGGIRFDEIMKLGKPWYGAGSPVSRSDNGALSQWAGIALSPRPLCPYTDDDDDDPNLPSEGRKEALLRTYIADYTCGDGSASREHLHTYVEAWCDRAGWTPPYRPRTDSLGSQLRSNPAWERYMKELIIRSKPDRNFVQVALDAFHFARHGVDDYLGYAQRIYNACSNRRLLVTKRGYIGLAPWNAQVGDVVAVLHGGETPFLLRPGSESGVYTFVGEAFVHGTMAGEALAWENAAAAARDFRIV